MWGCCSRATVSISALKPIGAEGGGQLRVQNLERHVTAVLQVAREIHRGHSPAAELALDDVAIAQALEQSRGCSLSHAEMASGIPRICAEEALQASYSREFRPETDLVGAPTVTEVTSHPCTPL
jgi:hypothetical protein